MPFLNSQDTYLVTTKSPRTWILSKILILCIEDTYICHAYWSPGGSYSAVGNVKGIPNQLHINSFMQLK